MSDIVILYETNTGTAKRYAELISEKTGCPCFSTAQCGEVPAGSRVVFIGWVMAGNIQGLKKARDTFGSLLAVCAVGMMKSQKQDDELKEKNAVTEELFSLPGAFDMSKLSGMHKMMMGMMLKMMKSEVKKSNDPQGEEILGMLEKGFDIFDEEAATAVVAFIEQNK